MEIAIKEKLDSINKHELPDMSISDYLNNETFTEHQVNIYRHLNNHVRPLDNVNCIIAGSSLYTRIAAVRDFKYFIVDKFIDSSTIRIEGIINFDFCSIPVILDKNIDKNVLIFANSLNLPKPSTAWSDVMLNHLYDNIEFISSVYFDRRD